MLSGLFIFLGIKTVLITLGKQGTYFATKNQSQHIEAYKVNAIDTTAPRRHIYWCICPVA